MNRKDESYILLILIDLLFRAKCNSRKISGNFSRYFGGGHDISGNRLPHHWGNESTENEYSLPDREMRIKKEGDDSTFGHFAFCRLG
jgi:hypothetical protein